MKFLICVDLEGCACVVGNPNQSLTESTNYAWACRQGAREANAAVKALFDSGAESVLVWDAHGGRLNLNYDELDERCEIVLGTGWGTRMEFLEATYAGVLFVGYHSKDNTSNAVLAHTFNSKGFQWIKINDAEVGEIEVDAAIAGDKGVPVIFISSDHEGCRQAKEALPWVETVTTKRSLGWNMAVSKHPKTAVDAVYQGVVNSVQRLSQMRTYTIDKPVNMKIRYKRIESAQAAYHSRVKNSTMEDAYTVLFNNIDLSSIF